MCQTDKVAFVMTIFGGTVLFVCIGVCLCEVWECIKWLACCMFDFYYYCKCEHNRSVVAVLKIKKSSVLDGSMEIRGNASLINAIKKEVQNCILVGKEMYETQMLMERFMIQKCGKKWYRKSRKAINSIIKSEYTL